LAPDYRIIVIKSIVKFGKHLPNLANSPFLSLPDLAKYGRRGWQNHMVDKLKALKEQSGLTVAELSDLTGIPADTINKILSGQTKNPNFRAVCDLVFAMGGSVDEVVGMSGPEKDWEEITLSVMRSMQHQYLSQIDDIKARRTAEIENLKRMSDSKLKALSDTVEKYKALYESTSQLYEQRISSLEDRVDDHKHSRKYLATFLAITVAFVFFILAFDLLNAGIGFIQY